MSADQIVDLLFIWGAVCGALLVAHCVLCLTDYLGACNNETFH